MEYRGKKVSCEMMLYSDLIVKDGKTFVEELDITDLKIYKDKPSSCPCCKSKKVIGLEVLGTKEGTLMWICDDCDSLFLKYDLEKTEKWIEKGKGFWTNPLDWPEPTRDQFN
tara:strand:- start:2089 stop:2424 length:336 start_codon:yes stop_codon:yes gene_type:complete